jgi:GLPGLI family protein
MKKIFSLIPLVFCVIANAQQFVSNGSIEFEVRTNNHKAMGEGIFAEMFRDKIPQFSTNYYDFVFNDNKAVYKFNRSADKTKNPFMGDNSDNLWYSDYTNGTFIDQKNVFGDVYILSDSLMNINWKLSPNETREIAGFNCRKATGIIFDSVYVFAFYTDEIAISGGPMGIHGLPGMILGITIPRMYTSWIATKLQVVDVDPKVIAAPSKGKKKKATELLDNVKKVTADWGSWGQQAIWGLFL